jgi:hypothetical protein
MVPKPLSLYDTVEGMDHQTIFQHGDLHYGSSYENLDGLTPYQILCTRPEFVDTDLKNTKNAPKDIKTKTLI